MNLTEIETVFEFTHLKVFLETCGFSVETVTTPSSSTAIRIIDIRRYKCMIDENVHPIICAIKATVVEYSTVEEFLKSSVNDVKCSTFLHNFSLKGN